MAFRIYVGNYPTSFTLEDVQNLFRDFDGVKVEKVCHSKQNSKSFAFLTCNEIDQLVSVVKNMNRTSVSGRNLIVRASDQSLQDYVSLILQNEDTFVNEQMNVKEDTSVNEKMNVNEDTSPMKIMRNKYRPKHKMSDSEKSDIHDKFDANSVKKESEKILRNFEKSSPKSEDNFGANSKHFEKHSPKQEGNFGISEKKSPSSSRSMHNVYQQKRNTSDCETSPKDPHFSSKIGGTLNNQTNLRSINQSQKSNAYFSGSPSNSYQSGTNKNEHEYFETSSNHYSNSSQKNYHQTTWQKDTDFPRNTTTEPQKYCQQKSEKNDHDHFNNFSRYSYNNTSDDSSQVSSYANAEHFYDQRETNVPVWVSVTNFKIGTSARAFYDLFSDYKPLRVKMICNMPRKDKMLAEAHVCFPNREIADDVIMNFDNTIFDGRIILVNDVEDLTMMNELLNISHS